MNATADPAPNGASPAASTPSHERHLVLRHRLRVDGLGVPIIGGGFLLSVLLLTGTVSMFTDIRISGWGVGTQLVRWFVGAIGVYLTAIYLPLYVAHGRTRRDTAVDSALFAGIYVALVAVLVAVGFAIEGLVYRIADWPQTLDHVHLFDAPDQYHLVLLEFAVVLAVWVAAGAMLGAGFYRHGGLGMALIPVGLAAVPVTEAGTGPGTAGPFFYGSPPPLLDAVGLSSGPASPLAAVVTSLLVCAVLGAVTWPIVRDVPIRPKVA